MELAIVIGLFVGFGLIIVFAQEDYILSRHFWWDTYNGLQCSTAKVYYNSVLNKYIIRFECNYKHPKEHSEYEDFLKEVEELKHKNKYNEDQEDKG
jgi:hypothetical protein